VLAVSYGIRGVNAAAWTNCPAGSADQGSASGYHECVVNNGYYLKSAGTDATGQDDAGIDIQLVPAGYWSEHASPIFLTTTTTTHVWDGTTDDDLGSGNAAATSGVTKCDVAFTNAIAGSLTTATTGKSADSDCVTKAGYYISVAASTGTALDATTAIAPYGQYVAGGTTVKGASTVETPSDCQLTFGNAIAGSLTTVTTGKSADSDCVTKAGYGISVAASTGTALDATTAIAPLGTYVAGGTTVKGASVETPIDCQITFTNAIAGSLTTATTGSSFADDCVTKAGYYISDAGLSGDIYDATTALAPVGTYVAGGKAVKGSVFDDTSFLPVDCPFGGSSAAGSSALTDCTPDCDLTDVNSGAVASGGTCQCAAGYYGVPTDTNAATLAAAITGCTSCARGTTSTAGTTTVSGCTASTTVSGCTASTSSAGATAPIAVALAAAAAVPLLL